MKKDTYYFSHDSNTMDDYKIVKIIDSLGMEDYGIFWGLIEILRNQPDHTYPVEAAVLKYRQWNTSQDKIKVVILNYDLFVLDDKMFYSESLLKRMQIADNKRQKRVNAGKKGGLQKANNQLNRSNAKAMLKQKLPKESKLKEIKVKEIKEKEIEILINYSFDDFWNLYDKKVGKKQPLESKWLKFSDDKRHTIMEYVKNYVNSTPNKKYRKNPQTFFNGEGWNDELINEKNEVKLTDIEWLNL